MPSHTLMVGAIMAVPVQTCKIPSSKFVPFQTLTDVPWNVRTAASSVDVNVPVSAADSEAMTLATSVVKIVPVSEY